MDLLISAEHGYHLWDANLFTVVPNILACSLNIAVVLPGKYTVDSLIFANI